MPHDVDHRPGCIASGSVTLEMRRLGGRYGHLLGESSAAP
jgi:hypothetical protein